MAPSKHEALWGMLATAGGSLTFVALVVLTEWLEHQEWPAFAMLGSAGFIHGLALLVYLLLPKVRRRVQWPSSLSMKIWTFARGFASIFALACTVLATFFGCPAGDTMALSSTNVFASAVAGWLLFGEAFGRLRVAALLATGFGAVLVSKPEFIFTTVKEQPYLGYLFAAVSGLGLCGMVVCCRKLGKEVSPLISTLSASLQRGAILLLLAALPMWETDLGSTIHKLSHHPGWAVLWVLILTVLIASQTTLLSVGFALAPTGVSGVIVTCCDILFGYIGQIAVFGILPDAVTLAGVVLLLGSVLMITMETAKTHPPPEVAGDTGTSNSQPEKNEAPPVDKEGQPPAL